MYVVGVSMIESTKRNLVFWKIYLTGLFSGVVICVGIWGFTR